MWSGEQCLREIYFLYAFWYGIVVLEEYPTPHSVEIKICFSPEHNSSSVYTALSDNFTCFKVCSTYGIEVVFTTLRVLKCAVHTELKLCLRLEDKVF